MKTNWPDERVDRELSVRNPVPDPLSDYDHDLKHSALLDQLSKGAYPEWLSTSRPSRRRVLASIVAVAALLVGVVVVIMAAAGPHPNHQQASTPAVKLPVHLVDFTTANGQVVALITDPLAAASQLDAVFRQHGFDISLKLAPVSPSLVGTILGVTATAGTSAMQTIQGGPCLGGQNQCPVGLILPADFHGQASVGIGRAAQPGELYDSAAVSAFLPGEALHCGIYNQMVSTAAPEIAARGLKVEWREQGKPEPPPPGMVTSGTGFHGIIPYKEVTTPTPDYFVTNATPISSTTVMIEVTAQPDPEGSFFQQANEGC